MWDVTWGHGGPDRTIRCITMEEARDVADSMRAWGPVIADIGMCPWQIRARDAGHSDAPHYTYQSLSEEARL